MLQDVTKTMQYKDYFECCSKVLFFLKEVISCYNVLQQVTKRYKRLQKVSMDITFKVPQEVFLLIEGEKLL